MLNSTIYNHLALFICHLFVDGHFRPAQFVYKPNEFDFDLLSQIDTICKESIPWYLTDITEPKHWPWSLKDTPDNVLQLCFFRQNDLEEDILKLKLKDSPYYQVFAFHSNDSFGREWQIIALKKLHQSFATESFIVNYDASNVSVVIDSNENSSQQMIFSAWNDTDFKHVNLFDRTFGELVRIQPKRIAVQRLKKCDISRHGVDFDWDSAVEVLWMNFYHLQFNNSFIDMTWRDINKTPLVNTNQHCVLQPKYYYYKEIFNKFECTEIGNS